MSVPASQARLQAERLWRTGRLPEPPRRRGRLRRLLGSALTVILLAAAGVVLYLRFHHAPFHVTGVVISQAKTGCEVDVTARITTNGAAGTIAYQWLYRPEQQPPHPLIETAAAGQNAVYVTLPIEGQGHGSASLTVTLQVLSPDTASESTAVVVSC